MKKVIVCGAGIGGLVSAIYLSHKGHEVEIFEKNHKPGGKINQFHIENYRFDSTPGMIAMPAIIERFFEDIGRNSKDYIEFIRPEVACTYNWLDGTRFNLYSNEEKLFNELSNVFGETEKNNYFRYLNYGKLFYDLGRDNFQRDDFKIRNYISKDGLKNLTKFISGRSINDVSNKFFKDQKLKQLMDSYSAYNGSSPYLSPQLFSIIPYIEYKSGVWYINGGIQQLISSLVRLCQEMNIKIHYGCELTKIHQSKRQIRKLVFNSGMDDAKAEEGFDFVISNFTDNKALIDSDYFANDDWSSSNFVMLIGMKKEFEQLSRNNVLFSDDYEKECINIFEKKIPAEDMTVYINISKKDEKSDAPEGCENWLVYVNSPALSKNHKWTAENKKSYMEKILNRIDSFSFLFEDSIRNHISFCEIFTPEDFSVKYNSERGSAYGLSSNSLYTLMRRPKNKSKKFDNLFFAGGNTNPGGGIPLCFLSGRVVSKHI